MTDKITDKELNDLRNVACGHSPDSFVSIRAGSLLALVVCYADNQNAKTGQVPMALQPTPMPQLPQLPPGQTPESMAAAAVGGFLSEAPAGMISPSTSGCDEHQSLVAQDAAVDTAAAPEDIAAPAPAATE